MCKFSLGQRIPTDAMQLHGSSHFQPLSTEELDLIEMIFPHCHIIKVCQKKPVTYLQGLILTYLG